MPTPHALLSRDGLESSDKVGSSKDGSTRGGVDSAGGSKKHRHHHYDDRLKPK